METIKVLDREFVPYINHETIVSKIKEMAEAAGYKMTTSGSATNTSSGTKTGTSTSGKKKTGIKVGKK